LPRAVGRAPAQRDAVLRRRWRGHVEQPPQIEHRLGAAGGAALRPPGKVRLAGHRLDGDDVLRRKHEHEVAAARAHMLAHQKSSSATRTAWMRRPKTAKRRARSNSPSGSTTTTILSVPSV